MPLPSNRRGKSRFYSNLAIQVYLRPKILSRLPHRAAEGLVNSLMRLCGLNLPVLNHTHLWRQAATLEVKIPHRWRTGAIHVVVNSIGLKIFRESEWKVHQHGALKRCTWRKIHLSVDATAKDIVGIEITTTPWHDSEVFPDLLSQVEGDISQVSADGAYDTEAVHAAISEPQVKASIPRREEAVP